jgi:hypothetical protein
MKTKFLNRVAIFIFMALFAGFISPAAVAQEKSNPRPILLFKIRNVERFISDIEKLIPQAANQLSAMRPMLQGTGWIDSERSLTIAMFMDGAQSKGIMLIPFRTANPGFQSMLNAAVRKDYYIAAFPPQQKLEVNPALEESLNKASTAPVFGSLTMEASASKLLAMIEPQMDAAYKKMAETQPPQANPAGMTPQDTQAVLQDMLNILKQVDTIRLGMDLSGNILTMQYDIEARPNTLLAGILTDPQRDTRLMSFSSDLPVQFQSRAPSMSGIMELAKLGYGRLYRQLGINIDDLAEMTKYFTGEIAGGIKIDSNGLAMEAIYILQPGINGADFLDKTYLPWYEHYIQQLSEVAARQKMGPKGLTFERTPGSTVEGLKVIGIKENFKGLIPQGEDKLGILNKLSIEMRMASSKDLLFIASDDVKLANLIKRARSLAKTPAQGPTTLIDIKLGVLMQGIQSLLQPNGSSHAWPDNIGNATIKAEVKDGKLISRISINIDGIGKLAAAFKTQAVKK